MTPDVDLTRRDALAALAAAGIAGGAGALVGTDRIVGGDAGGSGAGGDGGDDGGPVDPVGADREATLLAVAGVLYPEEVGDVDEFVRTFVRGRAAARSEHADGVADAVDYLDEWCRAWYDRPFVDLDGDEREEALGRTGVDVAEPDPDGSDVERVRYYVVNDLLFALYSSPTGARLVGLENPQGHPGGSDSYQRGPQP